MDTPDLLPEIARILMEAGLPPTGIEDKARAWAQVRPLVLRHRRVPNPTFHEGWELRLVALDPPHAMQVSRVLRQLGIVPIRPYAKSEREVPVLSRDQWILKLLEIGAEAGQVAPVEPPAPQADIVRILYQAGLTADDLDEALRAWDELLPLVVRPEPTEGFDKKRHLEFVAASPVGAARIEERLHRLGIKPERPQAARGRIVVSVNAKRYPWLGALLMLGAAPGA